MDEMSQLLDNAWNNFVKFYDNRCRSLGGGGYLVCWKEIDVMGHLMRYLFEECLNNKVNIEIHLNCSLKQPNYSNEDFLNSLGLLQKHFKGHRIEPDIVLIKDDKYGPFELCLEAKHFHYFPWRRSAEELIIEDIERLQAYKKFKIAKSTALVVLDDCLHYKYPDTSKKIEGILNQYKNEISILYHIAPP